MTDHWGEVVPMPEPHGPARASDDDRDRTVAALRDAAGRGVLSFAELEERIAAVYSARTVPELLRLTADVPAPAAPNRPQLRGRFGPPALRSTAFRMHATVYGLTNGMLTGIWLLTSPGDLFWPFFPAAGWGIGLGAHFVSANSSVRRREGREDRSPTRTSPPELPVRPGRQIPGPPPRARDVRQEVRDAVREVVRDAVTDQTGARRHDRMRRTESTVSGRRFVVAAFVDVVGSTSLNSTLGDERWATVRHHLHGTLLECARAHGGREANRAGDGVLLRFEEPDAAVRASAELLRRLQRQRAETGFAPSVRIGIHSGDAVDEGTDIIGNVVNLAARVMAEAEPDEIVVTEHVADHLGSGVLTTSKGLRTLKGVAQPRNLIRVDWS